MPPGQTGKQLGAGASEIMSVLPPTNSVSWKLVILVYPEIPGTSQRIKTQVTGLLQQAGIPTQFRIQRFQFESKEVESQK